MKEEFFFQYPTTKIDNAAHFAALRGRAFTEVFNIQNIIKPLPFYPAGFKPVPRLLQKDSAT